MLRTATSQLRTRLALGKQGGALTCSIRQGHGSPHYNEPGGYLFGEPPLKPGEKRKWEDWEAPFYYGFGIAILVGGLGLYFKPDTRISTWAYLEAERRLKERNEMPTFESSAPK